MALPLAPLPVSPFCGICGRPAVAVFSVGQKEAPQCAVHGYIVLVSFDPPARVVQVLDRGGYGRLLEALTKDGHPLPVFGPVQ